MKLMTINTHSYIEPESEKKLDIFVDSLSRIQPDIIAMQEVNQRIEKKPATVKNNLVFAEFGIALKEENFGLRVCEKLFNRGLDYKMVWVGIKHGFEIFDEGLCFLCKVPITSTDAFNISKTTDIKNWKKRMALGIEVSGEWFYNVHLGRWDDSEEPFLSQWSNLLSKINPKKDVWLMGDFNSPADYESEGYSLVLSSGFYDTYTLAKNKDDGYTVTGKIDGWHDKSVGFKTKRIDYIFTNSKKEIKSSFTIFNGKNEKIISDHFGILVEQ